MLTPEQIEALQAEPLQGANRVRRARELAEQTQVQVCAALKLSQPYYSAIERGDYREMPLETSRTLAQHFGCSIEVLFPAREEAHAE
jgi:transcriptional regulator with XRE-family HTH domain